MPVAFSGRAVHRTWLARLPQLRRHCHTSCSDHIVSVSQADSVEEGFSSGVPRLYDDKLNVVIECSFQHGRSARSSSPCRAAETFSSHTML